MKTFESRWDGNDGIAFFMQGWEPDSDPKALIALVHGLGEHSGRYIHVGKVMADTGFALAGFDLRGHGKSGGARGHCSSLDAYLRDIRQFLDRMTKRYPGLPCLLYGHSLGGLLSLSYALQYGADLSGVIVTGAALRSSLQEQKTKLMLVNLLGTLMPTTTIQSGLDPTTLSRDQKVVDEYVSDKLVHYSTSLGLGKAALRAIDLCFANARAFSIPLLIMHGSGDKLTYSSGSEDFARLVRDAGNNVTLKLWDGLYHEIHNEPEKAEVFAFMTEWLDKCLKGSLSSHNTEN
jgi:alpha-beta hydrolase superfamily lysophospholipase